MTLTEYYTQLMILQYYEQPRARAEIEYKAGRFEGFFDFIKTVQRSFDLDNAVDDRLDKIGKLVGVSRVVPLAVQKRLFGFEINPNSVGFASKFNDTRLSAPFSRKRIPDYTDSQLSNFDYRLLIRAKIALNTMRAVMTGTDESVSIQDVIQSVFDGDSYVVDRKDMSLALLIPYGFDLERLRIVRNAGLLPSPQGVNYNVFYQSDVNNTFGFDNNLNSKGFSSKFNDNYTGGQFARKVII